MRRPEPRSFISDDAAMLDNPRVIAVVDQLKLTLVICAEIGHYLIAATGLLLAHLPRVANRHRSDLGADLEDPSNRATAAGSLPSSRIGSSGIAGWWSTNSQLLEVDAPGATPSAAGARNEPVGATESVVRASPGMKDRRFKRWPTDASDDRAHGPGYGPERLIRPHPVDSGYAPTCGDRTSPDEPGIREPRSIPTLKVVEARVQIPLGLQGIQSNSSLRWAEMGRLTPVSSLP